jgi:phosphoglycerate dehydrogenase-like enzyme
MPGWKVVVTAKSFGMTNVGWQALERMGATAVNAIAAPGDGEPDLAALLADADAAIVGTERVDKATIAGSRRLKVVVKAGTGIDNIDVAAATGAGVRVGAVPGANAGAVADYAIALMLAAARRICEVDRSVRRGEWSRFPGADLFGATVGVVGLGHVGQEVCARLSGFSPTVLGTDVAVDEEWAHRAGVRITDLEEILRDCDFITLHVPLTDETRGLIDKDALARMKPTAILVNTARGPLIDLDALYDALAARRIMAAALDVFPTEPLRDVRFRELDNVVLSSHNASYSRDGVERTVLGAVGQVEEAFRAGDDSGQARTPSPRTSDTAVG